MKILWLPLNLSNEFANNLDTTIYGDFNDITESPSQLILLDYSILNN